MKSHVRHTVTRRRRPVTAAVRVPAAETRLNAVAAVAVLLLPLLVAVAVRGELWAGAVCFGASAVSLWLGLEPQS